MYCWVLLGTEGTGCVLGEGGCTVGVPQCTGWYWVQLGVLGVLGVLTGTVVLLQSVGGYCRVIEYGVLE